MSSNGKGPKAHRKKSSNPFQRKGGKGKGGGKPTYQTYEQEADGSSIFHELDPSPFPISKSDPLWMESSATECCSICLQKIDAKLFGTKKRHCKKCGRVVCIPCSDIRIRKHRVCEQCNKYYLSLNNLLNQWYRTNRNLMHSLCGYDSYTLEKCSSLKRTLFILNHYHQWLLLKRDGQLSQKHSPHAVEPQALRKLSHPAPAHQSETSRRAKVTAPFDITHIPIRQFVDRLPKYNAEMFLSDIHHLKQMHFKKNQNFKISHYEKKHQWEIRAYSWKKIGKCDRYGCPYGIKDHRNGDHDGPGTLRGTSEEKCTPAKPRHRDREKNTSIINMDLDIPQLLNNMHVVLLHGVEDEDAGARTGTSDLYDLLPSTPMSPDKHKNALKANPGDGPFFPKPDDDKEDEAPVEQRTSAQQMVCEVDVSPLSAMEYTGQRHATLLRWLEVCCFRFDFFSQSAFEWEAIQKKKAILSAILDYLDMTDAIWDDEAILKGIMKMMKANLFRSLPLTFRQLLATPDYCQEDDSEEVEDPHYPHLCYVYEIALMFVRNINVDDKTRKRYLGKSFIVPLTELFASEDVREREYLKAILHGIYARNMRLRRLIRTQMSNCCFRVIFSGNDANVADDIENGISECLQLVCSIIQGLTTPIKAEYKNILYRVLIPLHKANSRKLHKFHETLLACCIQFILKDLSIGLDILDGLLRFWPHQSASKSDMFLKEVVIIVNTMMTDIDTTEFEDDDEEELSEEQKRQRREKNLFKFTKKGREIAHGVIEKLVECMTSDNHVLAEKALLAFGEVGVQKLIDCDKQRRWTRVLAVLFDNRDHKRHWCVPLHESFDEALDTFVVRDEKAVRVYDKQWKHLYKARPINEFKNGYNPIYPSQALFTGNVRRVQKYRRIQEMAASAKKK